MIDIHVHLANHKFFPKYFTDGIIESIFSRLEPEEQSESNWSLMEKITLNALSDIDASKLLKQAHAAGIKKSVLLIVDFFYESDYNNEEGLIESIHEHHFNILQNNPEEIMVFSGIDPRRGKKGLDLLEKYTKQFGFKGLKLYPPCGFELDDRELMPYYELCEYLNIPVLTHTGPSLGNMTLPKNYPDSVIKVTDTFKKLKIILGHAGILHIDDGITVARHKDNVYLDISGFQREINDIEQVEAKFKRIFDILPEKILFGTDWPLFNFNFTQKGWIDKLNSLKSLSDKNKEMLFVKNSEAVLNIHS